MLRQALERAGVDVVASLQPAFAVRVLAVGGGAFAERHAAGLRAPRPELRGEASAGDGAEDGEAAVDDAERALEDAVAGHAPDGPRDVAGVPGCQADDADGADDADAGGGGKGSVVLCAQLLGKRRTRCRCRRWR